MIHSTNKKPVTEFMSVFCIPKSINGKKIIIFMLAISCIVACKKEELNDHEIASTVATQDQSKGFTITTNSVFVGSAISASVMST